MTSGIRQGVVVHPAPYERIQLVSDCLYRSPSIATRQPPHLALGSLQSIPRYADSHSACSSIETEAQKLTLHRQVY